MQRGTILYCILLVLLLNIMEATHGINKNWLDPKHKDMQHRTGLQLGAVNDAFYKNCDKIFKDKDLVPRIVHGMVSSILNHLDQLCLDKPIHPLVHKLFTEDLLCGESLSSAISNIMSVLSTQNEKHCVEKKGFKGIFVLTTMENEKHDD